MEKITYIRKRLNREQWKAIINECRSSGMTISVANVMYQKYVNSVPLHRQEKGWENLGLNLTRVTIAH